jgi:hypothetical protein
MMLTQKGESEGESDWHLKPQELQAELDIIPGARENLEKLKK